MVEDNKATLPSIRSVNNNNKETSCDRQCKARNAKGAVEGMAKHRKGLVGRVKWAVGDGN